MLETIIHNFLNYPRHMAEYSGYYGTNYPQYTIDQNETKYIIKFVIPGIDKKDLKIEFKNWQFYLFIKNQNEEQEFSNTFTWSIPEDGDIDKSTSELRNGILTIELPRKQHQVKVLQIN